MNFEIKIEPTDNGRYWRFQITEDGFWIGGFSSYARCYDAAVLALRNTAVDIIRAKLQPAHTYLGGEVLAYIDGPIVDTAALFADLMQPKTTA